MKFPDCIPKPNFEELIKVLEGNITPNRVHFVELFIDEIKKYILEQYFNEKNFSPIASFDGGSLKKEIRKDSINDIEYKNYYIQQYHDYSSLPKVYLDQ